MTAMIARMTMMMMKKMAKKSMKDILIVKRQTMELVIRKRKSPRRASQERLQVLLKISSDENND